MDGQDFEKELPEEQKPVPSEETAGEASEETVLNEEKTAPEEKIAPENAGISEKNPEEESEPVLPENGKTEDEESSAEPEEGETEEPEENPDGLTDEEREAAEKEEKVLQHKKKVRKVWKTVGIVLACLAAAALLGFGIYWVIAKTPLFKPNDIHCRESYTVNAAQAEKKGDTVVASVGEHTLKNSELQLYYWMQFYNFLDYNGNYLPYIGLDVSKPLDEQVRVPETGETWQDYFLEKALESWHRYQSLTLEAEKTGFKLSDRFQASLDHLDEMMDTTAAQGGYASKEEMLTTEMGPGCTMEDYRNYMYLYYMGYEYFASEFEKLNPTDEEIKEYFIDHAGQFEEQGVTMEGPPLVDIRHILIAPKGKTQEDGSYTEEQWEECRREAEAVLDQWLQGDRNEESFADLAEEKSEDNGSNANGGLYTGVRAGEMLEEFNDWCFTEGRKPGDYGIVKTVVGYHIMYYSGDQESWYVAAKNALLTEVSNQNLLKLMEQYPMTVDYKKIAVGEASMQLGGAQ